MLDLDVGNQVKFKTINKNDESPCPAMILAEVGRNYHKRNGKPMELVVIGLVMVMLLWGIVIYNRLVRDKNRVLAAWSDIDVQLKRRYDLIPKLVDAVRQYAEYEQATLATLVELRNRSEHTDSVSEKGRLEGSLGGRLQRLLALAENYPDLKANQSFLALQQDLTDVETHIQYARRYYNGAVRNLNVRIDSVPDLVVARLFRFTPRDFFELDTAEERRVPEI